MDLIYTVPGVRHVVPTTAAGGWSQTGDSFFHTQETHFYHARRQLRRPKAFESSTMSTEVAEIFVSGNPTRENHHILYKARKYQRKGKLYAAWSDVGKLKVRIPPPPSFKTQTLAMNLHALKKAAEVAIGLMVREAPEERQALHSVVGRRQAQGAPEGEW